MMHISRTPLRLLLALTLTVLATASAHAQETTVITHSGTTVAPGEVRDVFLGEKQFAGATKLHPVDNAAAQEAFVTKALKMDVGKYGSVWTKKAFRDGVNATPIKSSDAETIEFVKKTPGAVGYVSGTAAGVNVVGKF